MNSVRLSAFAFAATLLVGGAALAQSAPPPPPGAAGPHGAMEAMREHRAHHGAAMLKAVHDVLNIRPEQEQAFTAFAASMHPEHAPGGPEGWAKDREGWKGHADSGPEAAPMSAPERADAMLKRFDERTSHMREALARHAEAVKTFYAVLSPEQRRTFDTLPLLMGHGAMGHMGGAMGHMGPGGGMGPMGGMGPAHPGD